ncbi:hypothetical protein C1H46_017863 [Malus baccata]|uniref:Uncharacterized protein n=1 Tax=Malus baccata TaxID=106549 RepID=A0A540MCV5_MALBA|nr:hypothetical protein C1H46_017863 [Malus baccata]
MEGDSSDPTHLRTPASTSKHKKKVCKIPFGRGVVEVRNETGASLWIETRGSDKKVVIEMDYEVVR